MKWTLIESLVLFVGLILVPLASCASASPSPSPFKYTEKELVLIQKLRRSMGDRLYADYMTSDDFLISWLRARDMNLLRARDMLTKSLRWRLANKIDTILQEDFGNYTQSYRVDLSSRDRSGRPLLIFRFGSWNISAVSHRLIGGQRDRERDERAKLFTRYMESVFERTATTVREANATSGPSFGNVTKMSALMDMAGYTNERHATLGSIALYKNLLSSFSGNYPGMEHKFILVNTPPSLENNLLRILRPFLSPTQKEALVIFGQGEPAETAAKVYLLEVVETEQLPVLFGGNKEVDLWNN